MRKETFIVRFLPQETQIHIATFLLDMNSYSLARNVVNFRSRFDRSLHQMAMRCVFDDIVKATCSKRSVREHLGFDAHGGTSIGVTGCICSKCSWCTDDRCVSYERFVDQFYDNGMCMNCLYDVHKNTNWVRRLVSPGPGEYYTMFVMNDIRLVMLPLPFDYEDDFVNSRSAQFVSIMVRFFDELTKQHLIRGFVNNVLDLSSFWEHIIEHQDEMDELLL
jgi:hypothetical protein